MSINDLHTCHAGCPCHSGGVPLADFETARPTLTLEKTRAMGRIAKGERITFTFSPGTPFEELLPCAYRNLMRIHPDENTMCWEVAA